MALNFQKILCPIQFNDPHSLRALDLAQRWSLASKACIFLLHIIPSNPVRFARPGYRDLISSDEVVVRQALERLAAAHLRDAPYQIIVKAGDPAEMISLVARGFGIDIIIMSTHDYAALPHPPLSGIVEKVEREAPCIVLTIYPEVALRASSR
jgi:nucleotide-binding universal stress UspA family protein